MGLPNIGPMNGSFNTFRYPSVLEPAGWPLLFGNQDLGPQSSHFIPLKKLFGAPRFLDIPINTFILYLHAKWSLIFANSCKKGHRAINKTINPKSLRSGVIPGQGRSSIQSAFVISIVGFLGRAEWSHHFDTRELWLVMTAVQNSKLVLGNAFCHF